MTISSRTPEGRPNSCPICLANVVVEPSVFFGDATCPNCGQLLWFIQSPESTRFFSDDQQSARMSRVLGLVSQKLGVDRDQLFSNSNIGNELGVDSLELVEWVMAIEEEMEG